MLVERCMVSNIPFLLDIFKICAEFLPSRISILECEILPQFLVEELIDWGISVDAGAGVTVPIPDTSRCSSLFKDAYVIAELSQSSRNISISKLG